MNLQLILTAACFVLLLLILWADFFLNHAKRVIFMSNQKHVAFYVIPILFSFISLILSQNTTQLISVSELLLVIMFIGIFLYISRYNKIILRNAIKENVVEELVNFLNENNRINKVYKTDAKEVTLVGINNLKNSFTVRDSVRWVEIDTMISNDSAILLALDKYFKEHSKTMPYKNEKANIFFVLLNIFIIAMGIYFTFYTPLF